MPQISRDTDSSVKKQPGPGSTGFSPALESLAAAGAAELAAQRRRKIRLPLAPEVHIYNFERFQGITQKDLEEPPARVAGNPALKVMRDIVLLDRLNMFELNQGGQGIPPDKTQWLLDALTTRGARVVVLHPGPYRRGEPAQPVLGFGLIFKDCQYFPDRQHIPRELLELPKVCRFNRFFISEEARALFPKGRGPKYIMDGLKAVAGPKGIILAKVLIGPKNLPQRYFRAEPTLVAGGKFGPTSYPRVREKYLHSSGQESRVDYKWYTFPPQSERAWRAVERQTRRYEQLDIWVRQRLSAVAACVPTSGARLVCLSREGDGYELAALHPRNSVIAVQVGTPFGAKPQRTRRQNYHEMPGFNPYLELPAESVDAFIHFSVLPDIAALDLKSAKRALKKLLGNEAVQLRDNGVILIRNTLRPATARICEAEFSRSCDDASGRGPSTARLFEIFLEKTPRQMFTAREWRAIETVPCSDAAFLRYRLPQRVLDEFILKKDYIMSSPGELNRSFTAYSADYLSGLLQAAGMRVLYAAPETSRFIAETRWRGKVRLYDLRGREIRFPASNFVIVAQKVAPGEGVRIEEASSRSTRRPRFLRIASYVVKDTDSGKTVGKRELVDRPNETLDVIGHFAYGGMLYFTAKQGYPRAVTQAKGASRLLDRSQPAGYLTEQIGRILPPAALNNPKRLKAAAARLIRESWGLKVRLADLVFSAPTVYFPSAGTVGERVVAIAVGIPPVIDHCRVIRGISGFSTSGTRLALPGPQILGACQRGQLLDARLERKVYEVTMESGYPLGPWIGEAVTLKTQSGRLPPIRSAAGVLEHPPGPACVISETRPLGFHEVRRGKFKEYDAGGKCVASKTLEWALPGKRTKLGTNMLAGVPVFKARNRLGREEIYVGVEVRDDLPVLPGRAFFGRLSAASCYKIPKRIVTMEGAEKYFVGHCEKQHGMRVRRHGPLGGMYYTSPGAIPEVAYPYWLEVDMKTAAGSDYHWVRLKSLVKHARQIQDAQLQTIVYRLNHACGNNPLKRLRYFQ